jgi:hypothetical protein
MMPRLRSFFLPVGILFAALSSPSQQQPAPPKLPTARQALIEMVTKGGDAIAKHLTVEVQNALKVNGKSAYALAMLDSIKAESAFQSFDSGAVLFAYEESAQHTKYEIQVDSDDLAGDQDSLSLSVHLFRDGKELDSEWSLLSSHFTVSMKLQQNIWRLDKISVGAEFPVGDPNFIEKAFAGHQATGFSVLPGVHAAVQADSGAEASKPPAMTPDQVITMLGYAQSGFARQHPDVGFTCSFAELAESSKMMGIDPQVNSGTYNNYRFSLSGCEGKPAGSFQVSAEPMIAGKGAKAFCTDATGNLRVSEDGRSATCLASGKVQHPAEDEEETAIGFDPAGVVQPKPKQ